MARKLRKIGHPLRRKVRRKKNKVTVDANPAENRVAAEACVATPPQDAAPETNAEETTFYTAKEAADMLDVTAKQVTVFLKDNRLPNAEKVSGKWRIPEADIQALKKEI